MKTAVIYARVSTTKQAEEGLSIEAQIKQLQDYAAEHSYEVAECYIDRGESARTADRPQFQQMISDVKENPDNYDAVLIHKTDRFARNREDSIVYKSLLRKECGVDVIAIKEDFGDGPVGNMVEGILESVAQFYSENLSNEIKKGLQEKLSRGEVVSEPPYGYLIGEDKKLKIYEPEAEIIRYIFQQYISGKGSRAISKDMFQNSKAMFGEVATIKKSTGKEIIWSRSAINHIIKNEKYVGDYCFGDKTIEDSHEAIISKDDFELVQQLTKDRATRRTSEHGDYLLRGLMECWHCGYAIVRKTRKRKLKDGTKVVDFYANCSGQERRGDCYSNFHTMKFLENQLIEFLKDVVNSNINISNIQIESKDKEEIEKEYSKLKRKLESFEERFDRQIEAYQAGVIDLEQLEKHKANLENEKKELQDKISKLETKVSGSVKKDDFLDEVSQVSQVLDDDEVLVATKRNMLLQIVDKIRVSKKDKLYEVTFKW